MTNLNEDTLAEQPVIEWLRGEGYDYEFGPDLAPGGALQERESFREVLLLPRLKRSLRRMNPNVSDSAIEDAIAKLRGFEHPSLVIANKETFEMITQGIKVDVRNADGEERGAIVQVFDFENPLNNEFLAVNQFAIQGIDKVRRPDVIIFVNGIPIAVFELKSPTTGSGTIRSAYAQLQDYKADIPVLFKYNQILIVSDLLQARHGTISGSWEWFATWKGVESEDETHDDGSELDIAIKGMFHKTRLLDIVQNFIVFEADSEKDATTFTKKMCMYHQYFGVNKAIQQTLRAAAPKGNKKIGVFWHTQGSGKTLSMVFYANKAKRLTELKSPTFVFLTDRNDLDGQFYKTFLRTGYATLAKQTESVADLKERLRSAGGELIFTTIQKFEGKEYEPLTDRDNIIVIADEAHRSQYAQFAGNARMALPNAAFMGITGTPVSLKDKDTRLVFGDHISEYTINRAVKDGATVPIYYEGRLVPLKLNNYMIDEEYEDLMKEEEFEIQELSKKKFARLEQAVGAKERLEKVAHDIVAHFNNRGLEGKGMIVSISRKVAVELYKIITKIGGAPEIAVVISKPEEFSGEIQKEVDVKELERRFKDPQDSLRMVIVCDMWLTGFDVPALHTMYLDKPLKNHTLMQAIARVNRIYKDKVGGLIVDYIGVADNLKKALSIYSSKVHRDTMIPLEEIIAKMTEKYDVVRTMFNGIDYHGWRNLESGALANLFQQAVNAIITDPKSGRLNDENKKRFLNEVTQLSKLHAFVMPHAEAHHIRQDVEFFKAIKRAIVKRTIVDGPDIPTDIDTAVRELVSKSIAAEGVIDIFAMRNKGRPDVSIFDEKFLEEVRNMKFKNLAVDVLRKLLQDELRMRMKNNVVRFKSLMELLEHIIEEYENNIIDSTKVIERLIELAHDIKKAEYAGEKIGLSEEEMAFYDALSAGSKKAIKDNQWVKGFVKELVKAIKRDLAVDWTNNEVIKSRIRANVRLMLLRSNQFSAPEGEQVVDLIYQQAFAMYHDFIPAYT